MTPPRSFRAPEVCRLAGVTYRQLDYWARTDLLRPSIAEARGSGTARRYSEGDLRRALVVVRLTDAGVSLQRVRGVLSLLDDVEGARWLYVGEMRGAVCTVVDLKNVWTTLQEVG